MASLPWDDPLSAAKGKTAHQLLIEHGPRISVPEVVLLLKTYGFQASERAVHAHRNSLGIVGPGRPKSDTVSTTEATESHDRYGDTWTIDIRGSRIKSLPEALKQCEVNLDEWRVDHFIINKWEVGRKDKKVSLSWNEGVATGTVEDTGKIFVEPLYQTKIWLVRKVEIITIKKEIEGLKKLALAISIRPAKIAARRWTQDDHLLELSIPDAHIGRRTDSQETGGDDYNLKLACEIWKDALSTLVARTSVFQFGKVVLVLGNDLMNFDNLLGSTTRGTPQSNDSSYYRTFETVRDLIVKSIEGLRRVAPVHVVVVQGNHDTLASWHLGDSMRSFFNRYKDVSVDNAPTPRKYLKFGTNMTMWCHGDKGKRANYPMLMATEQPEMFGATQYREAHIAHLHQTRTEEYNGVRVRILPSLTAADDWSAGNGYIGNIRSAEAYVYHPRDGLVGTMVYVVPEKFKRAK